MLNKNLQEYYAYRQIYMQYPYKIHIETIAQCNLKCDFCVYPNIDRKNDIMSNKLFNKIVDDLKEIPKEHNYLILPYKINEPLMDKTIFDKLKLINKKLPNAKIMFNTNGILLSEKNIKSLNTIENIELIWISLNAHNKKNYLKIMGVDRFDLVVKNIKNLLKLYKEPSLIGIGQVLNNNYIDKKFNTFINKEFGSNIKKFSNIKSNFLNSKGEIPEKSPCIHWFELSITANGIVSFCCSDGNCDYPIGDINKNTILEIYNSKNYKNIRENKIHRNFEPCNKCNFI